MTARSVLAFSLIALAFAPIAHAQESESESDSDSDDSDSPPPLPPFEEPVAASVLEEREIVGATPRTMLGPHGAVWLELGFSRARYATATATTLSAELGLRYRVDDHIAAEVSWGWTFARTRVRGEATIDGESMAYDQRVDRFEPGNPSIAGFFVHRGSDYLLEIGLAIALPTAAREDPGADLDSIAVRAGSEATHRSAIAMRGYRGAYSWAPERFAIALPYRVAFDIAPIIVEIDGSLAILFPVLGDRGVDVDVLLDLGAGVGANVIGPFAIGARIAGVGAPIGSSAPPFTLSIEPWMRLRFDPVQITARGIVNLTGSDRVGGSRGPGFGVFLGAGVEF